jgi:hypothetical protein
MLVQNFVWDEKMIKIAIVGPEESKWKSKEQIDKAKFEIRYIFGFIASNFPKASMKYSELTLVSGHCHRGGVDIWLEAIADELGIKKEIYPAEVNQWEDKIIRLSGFCNLDNEDNKKYLKGYKSRNIQIAEACDVLYCIVPMRYVGLNVDPYPKDLYCRHCKIWKHPTNGGCWVMKYAKKLGKETHLVVIE